MEGEHADGSGNLSAKRGEGDLNIINIAYEINVKLGKISAAEIKVVQEKKSRTHNY